MLCQESCTLSCSLKMLSASCLFIMFYSLFTRYNLHKIHHFKWLNQTESWTIYLTVSSQSLDCYVGGNRSIQWKPTCTWEHTNSTAEDRTHDHPATLITNRCKTSLVLHLNPIKRHTGEELH